jgi:hypothetical protein
VSALLHTDFSITNSSVAVSKVIEPKRESIKPIMKQARTVPTSISDWTSVGGQKRMTLKAAAVQTTMQATKLFAVRTGLDRPTRRQTKVTTQAIAP